MIENHHFIANILVEASQWLLIFVYIKVVILMSQLMSIHDFISFCNVIIFCACNLGNHNKNTWLNNRKCCSFRPKNNDSLVLVHAHITLKAPRIISFLKKSAHVILRVFLLL